MPMTPEKTRPRERANWGLWTQLRYRLPMSVTTGRVLGGMGWHPVCPRCKVTLEREYMGFCDRCGQRLDWEKWD